MSLPPLVDHLSAHSEPRGDLGRSHEEWELDEHGRWICPGCITPAEAAAVDLQRAGRGDGSCIRCGAARPEVATWLEAESGAPVCGRCLTPLEVETRHAALTTPHHVSAERLVAGTDALRRFGNTYLDTLEDDVSPDERHRLYQAAVLVDRALGLFDR